jgi:hypothetical protein
MLREDLSSLLDRHRQDIFKWPLMREIIRVMALFPSNYNRLLDYILEHSDELVRETFDK